MGLFLHLLAHIGLSVLAGLLVWKFFGHAIIAFPAAFVGGVLIDLDHLIDYFLAFGAKFRLEYFLKGYQFLESDKIYIFFHGWEYVVALLFFYGISENAILQTSLLSLALGMFFHLWTDVIINKVPLRSYFLFHRMKKRFDMVNLVTEEHRQKHLALKKTMKIRLKFT